jgi:hypothetical protein
MTSDAPQPAYLPPKPNAAVPAPVKLPPDVNGPAGRKPREAETPQPPATFEPSRTSEEIKALVDLPVPHGFTMPLVPPPDNAQLEQALLQQSDIYALIQKIT